MPRLRQKGNKVEVVGNNDTVLAIIGESGDITLSSTPSAYTQTYAGASKTVLDPSLSLGGTDYAADFTILSSAIKKLADNINAIIDDLQAKGIFQ